LAIEERHGGEHCKSGVELTLKKSGQAAFEKNAHGQKISPDGEKFDPHKHQAIGMVDSI
jgi:molecular chaperone GrpE